MPRPGYKKNNSSDEKSLSIYLEKISKHKTLDSSEEARIAIRIRKGDRSALEKLVKCNLRFVVSVCHNYQNQGLPLSDLINEGNLGLMRAAQRFDERKNFKFISYAVWWIRQGILQALAEQSRIIKVPLNRVGIIHNIGKTRRSLEQKYRRKPNTEEIAHELGIDVNEVLESIKIGNSHMSLDAPIQQGNNNESKLMDFLEDAAQEKTDESTFKQSLNSDIEKVLNNLTLREKVILKLYYGIGEETTHTLQEIGLRFNLTRERVRQIKEKALNQLKSSSTSAMLRVYT